MKKILNPAFLEGFVKNSLLKHPVIWLAKPAYLAFYLILLICLFTILGLILPIWFSVSLVLMSCSFLTFSFCVYVLYRQGKMDIQKLPPNSQFKIYLINLFFFTLILASSSLTYLIIKQRLSSKMGSIEKLELDKTRNTLLKFQTSPYFESYKTDYNNLYTQNEITILESFIPKFSSINPNNATHDSLIHDKDNLENLVKKKMRRNYKGISTKEYNKAVKNFYAFKDKITSKIIENDFKDFDDNLILELENIDYILSLEKDVLTHLKPENEKFLVLNNQTHIEDKFIIHKTSRMLDSLISINEITTSKILDYNFEKVYKNYFKLFEGSYNSDLKDLPNFDRNTIPTFKNFILTNLSSSSSLRNFVRQILLSFNIDLYTDSFNYLSRKDKLDQKYYNDFLNNNYEFRRRIREQSYYFRQEKEVLQIYYSLYVNKDLSKIKEDLYKRYKIPMEEGGNNISNFFNTHPLNKNANVYKKIENRIKSTQEYMKSDLESIIGYSLACFGSALCCLTIYQIIISTSFITLFIGSFISFSMFLIYGFLYVLPEFFSYSRFYHELIGGLNEEILILGFPMVILAVILFFNFTSYKKNKIVRKPKISLAFSTAFLILSFIVSPLGFSAICLSFPNYFRGMSINDNGNDDNTIIFISVFLSAFVIIFVVYQTMKKYYFIHNFPKEE